MNMYLLYFFQKITLLIAMGPKRKGGRKFSHDRTEDVPSTSQPSTTPKKAKLNLFELRKSLGIFEFKTSNSLRQTPAQWIEKELTGQAEVKKKRIYENIRFSSACHRIAKAVLRRFSPHALAAGLETSAVPTVQVNQAAQANRAAPAIQVSMHLWTQSLSISMMTRTLVRWILSYRESLTSELSGWRV